MNMCDNHFNAERECSFLNLEVVVWQNNLSSRTTYTLFQKLLTTSQILSTGKWDHQLIKTVAVSHIGYFSQCTHMLYTVYTLHWRSVFDKVKLSHSKQYHCALFGNDHCNMWPRLSAATISDGWLLDPSALVVTILYITVPCVLAQHKASKVIQLVCLCPEYLTTSISNTF